MVIFTGISYRSVWEADKYLRYGDAPIPQTDHPYIQFDKLELILIFSARNIILPTFLFQRNNVKTSVLQKLTD